MDPKSVCSPRAARSGSKVVGGFWVKRTWSPEWEVRRCSEGIGWELELAVEEGEHEVDHGPTMAGVFLEEGLMG